MSLQDILSVVQAGSPEEALARQVNFARLPQHIAVIMQSAAMIIVKKNGGVWLNNDVVLRLQVDDSEEPLKELRRVVEKWNATQRRRR